MMQPAEVHTGNYEKHTHGINIEEVTVVSAQMRLRHRRAVHEVSGLILDLGCRTLLEKKEDMSNRDIMRCFAELSATSQPARF